MFSIRFVVMLLALHSAFFTVNADAVQRAHVASYGLDSNTAFNCDVTRPCRFFQAATTVVDPKGEVVVLDSGGYGAVVVTKSISLIAPAGVYAGISVFPGSAGVNVVTPGVNVVLRGLTINSQGGSYGIYMGVAGSLSVINCDVANFSANFGDSGIAAFSGAKLRVVDTVVRDNFYGIRLFDGVVATISKVTVLGSSVGIYASSTTAGVTTTAAISESTLSDNLIGVYANSTTANALARASVIRTTITGGNFGIYSQGNAGIALSVALITVGESMVTGSAVYGLVQTGTGAILRSLGNNTVDQNTSGNSGLITTLALM